MPALAAAYGIGDRGCGRCPATDEIVMMLPARRFFMPGSTLFSVRKVAVRLPSTDARQPSSLVSSSGPGGVKLPPALATIGLDAARVLFVAGSAHDVGGAKRAGMDVYWANRLAAPPPEGRSIDVRFFNRRDIAAGST